MFLFWLLRNGSDRSLNSGKKDIGMKIYIYKLAVICVISFILGGCSESTTVDITEKFLIDIGFLSEVDSIEKQRKASWLIAEITTEEKEEIVNLIDRAVSETRSTVKNKIKELYTYDELKEAFKDKSSAKHKTIKDEFTKIIQVQIEELNSTLEIGLSDIRYRYGCCLQ
jgi:hypothetical protein